MADAPNERTVSSAAATVHWRVFTRRDHKSPWVEWGGAGDEFEARGWLMHVREEYPHYEVQLRKVTTTTEVVE